MEIIDWHPDLSRECGDRGLCVRLKLSVECSVCRMIYKVTTDRYALTGGTRGGASGPAPAQWLDDAAAPRPCPACGVVQTLSEHDRRRLQSEAEALITDAWVEAQSRKLAA